MEKFNWKRIWAYLRRYVVNKYFITFAVFALIVTFMGDQSIINRLRRGTQIRELEDRRDDYRRQIEQAKREIENLQNKDSLERFAREQFFMSAPGEDIYVVDE